MIKKELYERLQPIISGINKIINIDTHSIVANDLTITTCNTLWLQVGSIVVVDGLTVTVKSIIVNQSIVFEGFPNAILISTIIPIPLPYYWHGTLQAVGAEINIDLNNDSDVTPMVYLLEVVRENYNNKKNEIIGVTSNNVRILFLCQNNFNDWNTDDHYQLAIKPMRNLANAFIKSLEKSSSVGLINGYESIAHAKVGIYDSKGHSSSLFSMNLSGVELVLNIPFIKDNNCKC